MRTRASIGGRPLHPLLVYVALGAMPVSLLLDALHVVTGDAAWYAPAFAATVFGAGFLLLAIVPALVDYFASIPHAGPARRRATLHMSVGLALVGYFVASALLRWETLGAETPRLALAALAFNAAGNLLLVMQGYLGGTLVKRYRVAVAEGEPSPPHPARAAEMEEDVFGPGHT